LKILEIQKEKHHGKNIVFRRFTRSKVE